MFVAHKGTAGSSNADAGGPKSRPTVQDCSTHKPLLAQNAGSNENSPVTD